MLLRSALYYNLIFAERADRRLIVTTRVEAILFDLDGTLIDTTNLILQCFEHTWQKVCGLSHRRETLIETFGIPLREAMVRLLAKRPNPSEPQNGLSSEADLLESLVQEYRYFNSANHDLLALPFEGVCQTLSELRQRGYRIGVVTSKGRELALRGLKLCALDSLIDTAVFLEDTDRHKPDPTPILTATERLGLSPLSAAYIGDSRYDIIAGRAAGVRTVAALWGPYPRIELEKERPDHLLESVVDLLEIFH